MTVHPETVHPEVDNEGERQVSICTRQARVLSGTEAPLDSGPLRQCSVVVTLATMVA